MRRDEPPLPPEVRALLDQERGVPELPPAVRQRALARARAALTAYPDPATAMVFRPHRKRWFLAATFTCAVAVAAGATSYELRARFAAKPRPAARAPQPQAEVRADVPEAAPVADTAPAELGEPRGATTRARAAAGTLSRAEAAARELRILRPARAAVAREDFGAALGPIAEHARLFKDGRLAEERDALRVKALAGLGRRDDARRAAAAFKLHYPRSVLLPAVSRLAETGR